MIRLGLACSAATATTGFGVIGEEKNFITPSFVIHGRMSVGDSSPREYEGSESATANMVIRQVEHRQFRTASNLRFCQRTAGLNGSSRRTDSTMDLVVAIGSVEISRRLDVLSTRVPASAVAASDTCPSKRRVTYP